MALKYLFFFFGVNGLVSFNNRSPFNTYIIYSNTYNSVLTQIMKLEWFISELISSKYNS